LATENPNTSGPIATWLDEGEDSGIQIVPIWKWLLAK
jgi:predicted AAA+ superfamily ATPase